MKEAGAGENYVTQIISRNVKPEKQAAYEAWLRDDLLPTLAGFDGYQGVTILRPGDTPSKEYVIVQRWSGYEALCRWVESDERQAVLARAEPHAISGPSYQKETGLETWFQLPGEETVRPPPRYKMALLIWMVIAPLTLIVGFALGPLLGDVSLIPATYLRAGIVVLLMTYLVMPFARRILARWLES